MALCVVLLVYQRIVYTDIFEFVGADSVGACIVIFLSAVLLLNAAYGGVWQIFELIFAGTLLFLVNIWRRRRDCYGY